MKDNTLNSRAFRTFLLAWSTQLGCVELVFRFVVALVFSFDELVQIREDGVILGLHSTEIGAVADAPLGVELAQHDLDGVDMPVIEILVAAKKVLEK